MAEQEVYPILVKGEDGQIFAKRFSKREKDMMDVYCQTGNINTVSKEVGIAHADVTKFLKQTDVAGYIQNRFKYMADRHDLTEDKVMSKIAAIVDSDGNKKYDPSYLRGLEIAVRVLKLIQPAVQIAIIDGNPFSELKDDALDAEIMKRLEDGRSKSSDSAARHPN